MSECSDCESLSARLTDMQSQRDEARGLNDLLLLDCDKVRDLLAAERAKSAKLVEAVKHWKAMTARNRTNSIVANYEEFALACMKAFDNIDVALAEYSKKEAGK